MAQEARCQSAVDAKRQDLRSKQAPAHRSPANGLLDAALLRVHRAHDPRGVVGSRFRGRQIIEDQAIHEWCQLEDDTAEVEPATGNVHARILARRGVCIVAYTHV